MSVLTQISHRTLLANGINMHIAEAGSGPLVLFLHGWPEFWYSWRRQLPVIAEAGFHAVAPDLRGFGETDAPESPDKYTIFHKVGDIIGLLDTLGEKKAILVGHDMGADVAWHVGLFRPDRVTAIVALSAPYFPRNPQGDLVTVMTKVLGPGFYVNRFQSKEYAEEEWENCGHEKAFKFIFCGGGRGPVVPEGQTFFDRGTGAPEEFPPFFSEEDLKAYVDAWTKSGTTGGFNHYRQIRLTWELTAAWTNAPYPAELPALFITGSNDLVLKFPGVPELLQNFNRLVPGMKKVVIVDGAHHFVQWEAPEEVNKELLNFLSAFKQDAGVAEA